MLTMRIWPMFTHQSFIQNPSILDLKKKRPESMTCSNSFWPLFGDLGWNVQYSWDVNGWVLGFLGMPGVDASIHMILGFNYPRWCRISIIHSMTGPNLCKVSFIRCREKTCKGQGWFCRAQVIWLGRTGRQQPWLSWTTLISRLRPSVDDCLFVTSYIHIHCIWCMYMFMASSPQGI